jgi:hypothetical protein
MRQLLLPIGAELNIGNSIGLVLWSRLKRMMHEDTHQGED